MLLASLGKSSHDVNMDIGNAFAALLRVEGLTTQEAAAERLQECGMAKVKQPLISRWVRGVQRLTLEQMNQIEECLGKPRGWILARAGYVDVIGLVLSPDVVAEHNADEYQRALRQVVGALEELVGETAPPPPRAERRAAPAKRGSRTAARR